MIVPDPNQFETEDENLRADRRFKIELPVLVNTILEDQHGWVIDVLGRATGLERRQDPVRLGRWPPLGARPVDRYLRR